MNNIQFFTIISGITLSICVCSVLGVNSATMNQSIISTKEADYNQYAINNTASTQAPDDIEFKLELQRAIAELNLHDQCNFFRTDKLHSACLHIANNPVFKTSKSNGENYKSSTGCPSTACPTLLGAVEPTTVKDSVHSLSPWTVCLNTDMTRFPQTYYNAECLCIGCLNPATNAEDRSNTRSKEITISQEVIRLSSGIYSYTDCTDDTCDVVMEDIVTGCTCYWPY